MNAIAGQAFVFPMEAYHLRLSAPSHYLWPMQPYQQLLYYPQHPFPSLCSLWLSSETQEVSQHWMLTSLSQYLERDSQITWEPSSKEAKSSLRFVISAYLICSILDGTLDRHAQGKPAQPSSQAACWTSAAQQILCYACWPQSSAPYITIPAAAKETLIALHQTFRYTLCNIYWVTSLLFVSKVWWAPKGNFAVLICRKQLPLKSSAIQQFSWRLPTCSPSWGSSAFDYLQAPQQWSTSQNSWPGGTFIVSISLPAWSAEVKSDYQFNGKQAGDIHSLLLVGPANSREMQWAIITCALYCQLGCMWT